jgi:hypothetical protein
MPNEACSCFIPFEDLQSPVFTGLLPFLAAPAIRFSSAAKSLICFASSFALKAAAASFLRSEVALSLSRFFCAFVKFIAATTSTI